MSGREAPPTTAIHWCDPDWHGGKHVEAFYMVSEIIQDDRRPSLRPARWKAASDPFAQRSAVCCMIHLNKTIRETFDQASCAVVTIRKAKVLEDE